MVKPLRNNVLDPILTLLYPPRCMVCKAFGSVTLCATCLAAFRAVDEPACDRCGQSLGETSSCSHCTARPPAFDRARAMGGYDGVLKHAIHLLKFRDRPALAEPLGIALAAYAKEQARSLGNVHFDAVLPVPMHPARRRVRGYNQSERIAIILARELGVAIDDASLIRRRNVRPQVGLAQEARQRNLADAFAVATSDRVTGKVLLVVDDVSTTGSTLHECAKALKAAGAKTVYGLTLAAG